ncbi:MAG: hypothetical protein HQL99_09900 [Magnetococcales bacterium]|nr:hypothetical protein [Magnetococcales bacterium]
MNDHNSGAMIDIVARLNALLDQCAAPETLSAAQFDGLMKAWDAGMAELERFTDRFPDGVTPGDGTRERLNRLVQRINAVQPILLRHKSEVADQLFSENRRVQSLRRGYGAAAQGSRLFHQRA